MRKEIRIAVIAIIGVLVIAGWSQGKQATPSRAEARTVAQVADHRANRSYGVGTRNRPGAAVTETKVITVTETVTVVVERILVSSTLRHRWEADGTLRMFSENVYETRPVNIRPTAAVQTTASTLVNLNTATAEELDAKLAGIGPVMARRIIAARPFHSIEDLSKISGIGPRRMASIRPFVTVN